MRMLSGRTGNVGPARCLRSVPATRQFGPVNTFATRVLLRDTDRQRKLLTRGCRVAYERHQRMLVVEGSRRAQVNLAERLQLPLARIVVRPGAQHGGASQHLAVR